MLTTVVMLAALGTPPGQAGAMNLANVRPTYGPLGAARKDNKLLPGDQVHIAFDIEGITVAADGRVQYSMTTEVLDAKNQVVYKQEPRKLEAVNALGGTTVPASAHLDVGLDSPPGEYTVRVTVRDLAGNKEAKMDQKFQVTEKGFGVVRLTTTSDPEGRVPSAVFENGTSAWINAAVVGFARTPQGQPDVAVELRVLDEKGTPTLSKPFTGEINKDAPKSVTSLPVQFHLGLNRAGKYTVELKASCRACNKTTTLSFPLTVVAPR